MEEPRMAPYAKTYGLYFISGCMSLIETFQKQVEANRNNKQCLAFCYYMIGQLYSFAFEQASDEEKEELMKESENAYEAAHKLSKQMSPISILKLSIADAYSFELINSFGRPGQGKLVAETAMQNAYLAISSKNSFDKIHVQRVKNIINTTLKQNLEDL